MTEKEKIEALLFSDDTANVELALTLAESLEIDITEYLKEIERFFNQSSWSHPVKGKASIAQKIQSIALGRQYGFTSLGLSEFPRLLKFTRNVEILSLENNNITNIIPELVNMHKLERLRLGNNRFEHFPLEVIGMPSIRDFFLNSNQIEIIPPEIGNMTNIENLFLGNNLITTLPEEMQYLHNLKKISLADNPLDFNKIPLVLLDETKSPKPLVIELLRLKKY